ncbi:immunoglobulin-like domain-containing protein [Marinicrinis sediminis]|uniref:Immunoglobulin-like domain-containing protein n=1 Tax=Marinicrinis sediminis TaxID=1652465 RepID=A0ABW5R9P2_9BACL
MRWMRLAMASMMFMMVILPVIPTHQADASATNLALFNSYESTGNYDDGSTIYHFSYATDGNDTTKWISGSPGYSFIKLDLGAVETVNHWVVKGEAGTLKSARLLQSPDSFSYSYVSDPKASVSNSFTGDTIDEVLSTPFTTRYVALVFEITGADPAPTVYELELYNDPDLIDIQADKSALTVAYAPGDSATSVTQDVYLPTSGSNGSTITWASSDSSTVATNGTVQRPGYHDGNQNVTLTATISKGSGSDTKVFPITVVRQDAQDSVLTPTTASFDLVPANQQDVSVSLTLNGNTLSSVMHNGNPLLIGTDYTESGSTVTIKKEFLATLSKGTQTVTFQFNAGANQTFSIQVIDLTPPVLQQAEAGYRSVELTWQPVSGANNYQVMYVDAASGNGSISVPGYVNTYTFTELVPRIQHDFTVIANVSGGSTAVSNTLSAIPLDTPGAPTGVSVEPGNQQAVVSFSAPTDNGGSAITGYEVTAMPGNITVTGASSPITVTGLTNGTTYSFTVKANNSVATSAASDAASTTPRTVPDAPTLTQTLRGNGQVSVSFDPPAHDGDSAITGYVVTAMPGGLETSGTESPILVTGLTNGIGYTFTVQAVNAAGRSVASNASETTYPRRPDRPSNPEDEVEVFVNGLQKDVGKISITEENGQRVTEIILDENKLAAQLEQEQDGSTLTLAVNTKSDVLQSQLNGRIVKNMEQRRQVLEIQTNEASYVLPTEQLNMEKVAQALQAGDQLADMNIRIELATPTEEEAKFVENATKDGGLSLVAPTISFSI